MVVWTCEKPLGHKGRKKKGNYVIVNTPDGSLMWSNHRGGPITQFIKIKRGIQGGWVAVSAKLHRTERDDHNDDLNLQGERCWTHYFSSTRNRNLSSTRNSSGSNRLNLPIILEI